MTETSSCSPGRRLRTPTGHDLGGALGELPQIRARGLPWIGCRSIRRGRRGATRERTHRKRVTAERCPLKVQLWSSPRTERPQNVLPMLRSGETIFTVDAEDLADFRGKNSRLAEHGMVLRTKKGEHRGATGTFAWAEKA